MSTATIRDVRGNPVTVEVYERRGDYSSIWVGDRLVLWPTRLLEPARSSTQHPPTIETPEKAAS